MAKQTVNIGVSANDNTGDPLRTAFDKLNDNFDEVYAAGPVGTNITVSSNTIASTNTNGNIDLNPAGTGKVLINGPMDANGVVTLNSSATITGDIKPTANVTYNIGSDTEAYDEIHGNVLHVGSLILREVDTQLEIFRTDDSTNAILSGNSTTSGSVLNNGNTVVALTQDGKIEFFAGTYATGTPKTVIEATTNNITTPAVVATGNVTGGNIVTAGKITDGALISDSGTVTGVVALTASGAVTGGSLTDGTATLSSGALAGATTLTSSGAVTAGSLTDGTAILTSGAVTGATNITASGTVTGATLAGTLSTAAQTNVTSVGTLTSLDVTGNVGSGNVNTTAVAFGSTGIQERATYEMYEYLTSDGSAISATPTDAFGKSPNLDAGKFYEFFIQLRFTNSSTGNPVFGFTDASGDIHEFNCQLTTGSAGGAVGTDTKVFNNAGDTLTSASLNTAQDYVATYFGSCRAQTGGRLDINLSVSSGTVTPLAGSSFRFTERTAASFGDVA